MATKKTEPSNYMKVNVSNIGYDNCLLISAEDAMVLIGILGRADTIETPYNHDATFTSGLKKDAITVSPYPTETVNDLKKAAFLGISLTEYEEGKNAKSGSGTGKEPV